MIAKYIAMAVVLIVSAITGCGASEPYSSKDIAGMSDSTRKKVLEALLSRVDVPNPDDLIDVSKEAVQLGFRFVADSIYSQYCNGKKLVPPAAEKCEEVLKAEATADLDYIEGDIKTLEEFQNVFLILRSHIDEVDLWNECVANFSEAQEISPKMKEFLAGNREAVYAFITADDYIQSKKDGTLRADWTGLVDTIRAIEKMSSFNLTRAILKMQEDIEQQFISNVAIAHMCLKMYGTKECLKVAGMSISQFQKFMLEQALEDKHYPTLAHPFNVVSWHMFDVVGWQMFERIDSVSNDELPSAQVYAEALRSVCKEAMPARGPRGKCNSIGAGHGREFKREAHQFIAPDSVDFDPLADKRKVCEDTDVCAYMEAEFEFLKIGVGLPREFQY